MGRYLSSLYKLLYRVASSLQRRKKISLLAMTLFLLIPNGHAHTDTLRQNLMGTIQAIQTLEARFSEKGPQRKATGKVYLKRPPRESNVYGELKFVYDPPQRLEIVSTKGTVYVWNKKANTVEDTPLSSTPLFFFLRPEIRLGDAVLEKGLMEDEGNIYWTLTQNEETGAESPEVKLIFTRAPGQPQKLQLRGWVLTDATGNETHVTLQDVKTGSDLEDVTFEPPEVEEED